LAALAVVLVAGCSGARNVALPLAQNAQAKISAAEMSASYPQSKSPASFVVQPMPQTRLLPASAMANAPGGVAPRSVGALRWSQLSGDAVGIAVAPDGSLWALSDQPAGINKSIWHYVNGNWSNIPGAAASIAVGPTGILYAVNGTTGVVYAYSGSSWSSIGGGARSVTTGADGAVYILSNTNIVNGNSAVWKYAGGTWTQQAGSGSQLANSFDPNTYTVAGVGSIVPNGYFLLNSNGGIYYYSPGAGYVQFPGTASGLAPITGGFFELSYPSSSNELPSYFDYVTAALTAEPGAGVSAAAGPGAGGSGTQFVIVNAANAIWTTPVVSVSFNDYTTFGYDDQRDVFNPNSTAITPATLPNLHLAWQAALGNGSDYSTQTQPILATGISGHNGVLFVGGALGNVYAYDATSGALLWTKNFGQETYKCGASYTGVLGIGGSAAYDPATRSLYVVGNSNTSAGAYAKNTLYHLDAATGTTLGSVVFTPNPAGSTELDFGHTSVNLAGGIAYVGTGSFCDISSWRGRVVAINVPSMTIANTFFTLWDPNNTRGQGAQPWGGGGVWGWGGVAEDFAGNVLTGVGNGDAGGNYGTIAPPFVQMPLEYDGYAEALLELSGNLSTVVAGNHPNPQSVYASAGDVDLQGTPVVFTPTGCGTMIAIQGKAGELNVYNESSLSNGPVMQYQMGPPSGTDYFIGDPAYSQATGLIYSDVAQSTEPSLFSPGMVAISPGCGNPSVVWTAAFGSFSDAPRSVPAVSAGGVVFAGAGGTVWALNASTGAILNGGAPFLHTGGAMRMPVTIDGNWVFIIDNNGNLYGYTTDSRFPAIKARYRGSDARQRAATWQPNRD
jgi:hypothetical protein